VFHLQTTVVKSSRSRLLRFLYFLSFPIIISFIVLRILPIIPIQADPDIVISDDLKIQNAIDKFILTRLQVEKIEPSVLCSDEEFVRRVYLDVTGAIPPRAALKIFLESQYPEKRSRLIDVVLKSERYSDHFSVMWSDLLREHSNSKPKEGSERGSYREWIQNALSKNMPYDQFVRELLTASGTVENNAAVNFYLRDEQDRVETTNTVATVFMGTRMACAQCHDHPFDKWSQQDFHRIMAFFGRTNVVPDPVATLLKIEVDPRLPGELKVFLKPYFDEAHESREKSQNAKSIAGEEKTNLMADSMQMMGMAFKGREILKEVDKQLSKEMAIKAKQILQQNQIRHVLESGKNEYRMPVVAAIDVKKKNSGGEVVAPLFPWEPERKIEAGNERRKILADAILSTRLFAKVQVNRLWSRLMGRGIVDPIDDFREKNAPTHPELIEYLTDEFIRSKYDNKYILSLILNSNTYQCSSRPNESNKRDTNLYSHARLRRLSAEQLFDSILIATGRDNGLSELNLGKEAVEGVKKNKGVPSPYDKKDSNVDAIQWAVDLPTPSRQGTFLQEFNQPSREQICTLRDEAGSVPQSLEMLNGKAINDAIRTSPLIAELLKNKSNAETSILELYLSVFSRKPTDGELKFTTSMLKSHEPNREWLEDVCWALLNAREFSFNK
jgi:hypothetical protein